MCASWPPLLLGLNVRDICHGDQGATRAGVMQHKTQRPVQFEITPATREDRSQRMRHVNSCFFTMVAVDDDRKAVPVHAAAVVGKQLMHEFQRRGDAPLPTAEEAVVRLRLSVEPPMMSSWPCRPPW